MRRISAGKDVYTSQYCVVVRVFLVTYVYVRSRRKCSHFLSCLYLRLYDEISRRTQRALNCSCPRLYDEWAKLYKLYNKTLK